MEADTARGSDRAGAVGTVFRGRSGTLRRDGQSSDRAAPPSASRVAIVVAGMHRSGTSLTAHLLSRLGAQLPQDQVPPAPSNPLGHWEPRRLVELNGHVLAAFGRDPGDPRPMPAGWTESAAAASFAKRIAQRIARDYDGASLLLIKDPRVCRLLPLYATALDRLAIEMCVVL